METSKARVARRASHIAIGLWLSTVFVPCVHAQSQSQSQSQEDETVAEYVIGPEDVLDIAVWNNADISRTVPVRPDGRISLPLLNDVQAAGFTPAQLRETLKKALGNYIPAPAVSVIVREVHSFKVTVIGEVKAPGRYELKSQATVLDLLAMAGGLNEFASRKRIVVLRHDGSITRKIPFAYDELTAKRGSKSTGVENFYLQPGDVLFVP
jgi:polysaccharide export outer membrane protein